MTADELAVALEALPALEAAADAANAVYARAKADLVAHRERLMTLMAERNIDQVRSGDRTVTIATRQSIKVTNPQALMTWLSSNGFRISEFMQPDARRVQTLAKARLKDTGELVGGCDLAPVNYLSVKERQAKDAPPAHLEVVDDVPA